MVIVVKCFITASKGIPLIIYIASYFANLARTQLLVHQLLEIIDGLIIAAIAETIPDFLPTAIIATTTQTTSICFSYYTCSILTAVQFPKYFSTNN
jgi:hypothetical protein